MGVSRFLRLVRRAAVFLTFSMPDFAHQRVYIAPQQHAPMKTIITKVTAACNHGAGVGIFVVAAEVTFDAAPCVTVEAATSIFGRSPLLRWPPDINVSMVCITACSKQAEMISCRHGQALDSLTRPSVALAVARGTCVGSERPSIRHAGTWHLVFYSGTTDERCVVVSLDCASVDVLRSRSVLCLLQHLRSLPSRMGCSRLERVVMGNCV